MFFIIGGALAFFFEFLLLGKKNKSLADILLALWMLILGLHLLLYYFSYSGLDYKYTFLLGFFYPFPFLHGPMLLLYTAALTGKLPRWKNIHLLNFIPFLAFFIYYAGFFMSTAEEKIAFIEALKAGQAEPGVIIMYPLMLLSAITYLALTFLLIRRHQKNIQKYYSYSSEMINLHWLRNLLIGMTVIWIVVIVVNTFRSQFLNDEPIYGTVVLFVIFMGYFGIKQGNIFVTGTMTVPGNNEDNAQEEQKRYAKSGLKKDEANLLEERINSLMEKEKVFLDEGLTLPKLAAKLDILPNYLSQVINERFQKNFYDFVNGYRVEEFKKLVTDRKKRQYTLLALALECGFNSKSSFNKYFKKVTGNTPSEYMDTLKD